MWSASCASVQPPLRPRRRRVVAWKTPLEDSIAATTTLDDDHKVRVWHTKQELSDMKQAARLMARTWGRQQERRRQRQRRRAARQQEKTQQETPEECSEHTASSCSTCHTPQTAEPSPLMLCDQDHVFPDLPESLRGLEEFLHKRAFLQKKSRKASCQHAVLAEQARQRRLGFVSETGLRRASIQHSSESRKRARVLAKKDRLAIDGERKEQPSKEDAEVLDSSENSTVVSERSSNSSWSTSTTSSLGAEEKKGSHHHASLLGDFLLSPSSTPPDTLSCLPPPPPISPLPSPVVLASIKIRRASKSLSQTQQTATLQPLLSLDPIEGDD